MPSSSTPRSASARPSPPSPQPMSSTRRGERLSTASTMARSVTSIRLSMRRSRTAAVQASAFLRQDSTMLASLNAPALIGQTRRRTRRSGTLALALHAGRGAQHRLKTLFNALVAGGPVADADAHGGVTLPDGDAAPAGPIVLQPHHHAARTLRLAK